MRIERSCRFLGLLAAAALSTASSAQPAVQRPWMTGEQLVKLMGNVDPRTVQWSSASPFPSKAVAAEFQDLANSERVDSYIQAVHDASEGKQWCWSPGKPKPDELIFDARRALQQLPAAELKRNAADLIANVWRQKFPCPSQQRSRR